MNNLKNIIEKSISDGKSYGFIKKYFSDEIIKEYEINISYDIKEQWGRKNIKDLYISNKFSLFLNECKNLFPETEYEFYFLEGKKSGKGGTSLHFDPFPIIHLQIFGKTEWNIGKNALHKDHKWDEHNMVWQWDAEWIDLPDTFMLEPGDIIWFNNGIWHETKNIEDKCSLIFEAGANKGGNDG